jgi:serine/threonine-protein kinase
MPLAPGTRLGPYDVVSLIGEGGMGQVYRARDTKLNRDVALKTLPDDCAAAGDRLARFRREAQVLAALNHPNIAHIHGFEDSGSTHALVLELVEGPTLADRIAAGAIPFAEALPIATQIADALEAAHEQGVIHRDLKPANIKITPAGKVKVLDFGLAKLSAEVPASDGPTLANTTQAGIVLGTAAYMAPEQARGEATDARSDVFSFGVVLYEALSGKRAFGGDSLLDTLTAVVHREPPPLDSPGAEIVRRCLQKQPSLRFQTMTDVKSALQSLHRARTEPKAPIPSIAVLPFANMSRDADDEYFSDGLAEEIINVLAQMTGLKVIARTSAFAYKGKNEDIRRIADALGVTTVLEGSVRRAGSRIRVTAQLIEARDGTHLWSQRYDREMADIFAVQDEIAAAIADALKVTLSPVQPRRMPSIPAYEAYLRYRAYQWKFTPEATARSREYLEQALALDPDFALPYVGLADNHLSLATVGALRSDEAMPRARELARRALELDPDLPEAHAMLGIVAGQYDYDWREAGRRFERATAREPLSPHLRQQYASFWLTSIGRAEEAHEQTKRVIDEDPHCQIWHYIMSGIQQALGHDEASLASGRRAIELDPQFWLGGFQLGLGYAVQGRDAESLPWAEQAYAASPWSPYTTGLLAAAFANAGRAQDAEPLLARLHADSYAGAVGLTAYHLARRDFDQAAASAAQATDARVPAFLFVIIRPYEPWLRDRSPWPSLLRKLGLSTPPSAPLTGPNAR